MADETEKRRLETNPQATQHDSAGQANTKFSPDQESALATARHLVACGVPVLAGRSIESLKEWGQKTVDDSNVDDWRPGWALAAVMGHVVDGVDIDLQKDGAADAAGQLPMPKSYGRARTPSGGTHDLIATLDVRKKTGLMTGVDIQAGDRNGRGRGILFIAPTVRKHKLTGEPRAYKWESTPDLSPLLLEEDTTGTLLAEMVREAHAQPEKVAYVYDGSAYVDLTASQRANADLAVSRKVAEWAERLDGIEDWAEGTTDDRGRGWELLATHTAWAVASWAATPWAGIDADRATELYDQLIPEAVRVDPVAGGKWSADLIGKAAAAGESLGAPPWEDFADDSNPAARPRLVPGGEFILDQPDRVPAIWGDGKAVLWAEGEALTLCGPPGVGKTTVAGQLVRSRLLGGEVLGYTVVPTGSRVLYLAMDRPRQIARALKRNLGDLDRETLDARLAVWQGPPLEDIAKHPEELLRLAREAGADTVIVDSIKDAAVGLSDDEVGAGYNRARQGCMAAGIELLELHHMTKRGANGATPTALADLYGSTWIGAGAGSVVLLWGSAGDPIVALRHLKPPLEEVGPLQVIHDHDAGTSEVWRDADPLALLKAAGAAGLTAKGLTEALLDTDSPTKADIEKSRRKLEKLAQSGIAIETPGDRASKKQAVWHITQNITHPSDPVTDHGDGSPSRDPAKP